MYLRENTSRIGTKMKKDWRQCVQLDKQLYLIKLMSKIVEHYKTNAEKKNNWHLLPFVIHKHTIP